MRSHDDSTAPVQTTAIDTCSRCCKWRYRPAQHARMEGGGGRPVGSSVRASLLPVTYESIRTLIATCVVPTTTTRTHTWSNRDQLHNRPLYGAGACFGKQLSEGGWREGADRLLIPLYAPAGTPSDASSPGPPGSGTTAPWT